MTETTIKLSTGREVRIRSGEPDGLVIDNLSPSPMTFAFLPRQDVKKLVEVLQGFLAESPRAGWTMPIPVCWACGKDSTNMFVCTNCGRPL